MAPITTKRANTSSSKSKQADEKLSTSISKNFFKLVDGNSSSLTGNKIFEESHALITNIRSILTTNTTGWKKQETRDSLIIAATKLRNLNRQSNFHNKNCSEKLTETRQKVEAHYLSLQNIKNEIAHLKKNIDACLEFQPSDNDIELIELDDFYKNASEELRQANLSDPHQLYLARLKHELSERKSMLANLQELEGRKSALLSDIRGKEQRLAQLRPKIGSIKRSTGPLLDLLGFKKRSKHNFIIKPDFSKAESKTHLQLQPIYVNEDVCREIFGSYNLELGSDTRIEIREEEIMDTDEQLNGQTKEGLGENEHERGEEEEPMVMVNTKSFFGIEDACASSSNIQELCSSAIENVATIRQTISTESFDSIKSSDIFNRAIIIHRLNRLVHWNNYLKKSKLNEMRKGIEDKSSKLNTIIANRTYLKNSVDKCLEYESSLESDIDLIPLEKFYEEMQVSFSKQGTEISRIDSHSLHLARLKHELATRKSLVDKLQELEKEKKAVLSKTITTERTLNKVEPRVGNLKKIAKPLLDIVGLKSVALSIHNREIPFRPVPIDAETYKEMFGEKSFGQKTNGGTGNGEEELEDWERQLAIEIDDEL